MTILHIHRPHGYFCGQVYAGVDVAAGDLLAVTFARQSQHLQKLLWRCRKTITERGCYSLTYRDITTRI